MSDGAMKTLAEHVAIPAAVVDVDGGVRYANPAFEETFRAAEDGSVLHVLDAMGVGEGDVERVADSIDAVVHGPESATNVSIRETALEPRAYLLRVSDVAADDSVLVEACNLTAELDAAPYVGTLLERISDGFYAVDGDWRITYWNEQMADRTGERAEDVVGEVLWEVFPDLLGTPLEEHYRAAMRSGESRTFTHYLESPYEYWVEVRAHPDEHGMSVFSQDVTAEMERKRELERYETIVENANDAVMMKDRDGRYQLANETVAAYVGLDTEEIVGKTDAELFGPEVGERIRERERPALEREEAITYEERIPTPDGEVVFETTRVPYYEDGELAGTIGICRDVTEQDAYERRLEARSEKLELLNRILRHDIRNDMTVVLAVLDLLGEHVTDAAGADLVAEVRQRSEHVVDLTAVLQDLMTVVLEDSDDLQRVSIQEVVESELADVDAAHPRAITRIEGDLPDVDVRANEMLHSVFRNLFKNAVQHSDQDLPEVAVRASVDESGDTVTVRVADNGPGIPDDRKQDVFGRGEHGLESTGTGIGLYLVDRLVEEYGGCVHVEDNDPRGAVFVVELRAWGED